MNKKYFNYIALFCLVGFVLLNQAYGQSKDIPAELYKASSIPDSLKKDANAVVRYYKESTDAKGPGKAVFKTHSLITILNEKGNDAAEYVIHYDTKFDNVDNFEMIVYNADGAVVKKYHKSDMYDGAGSNSETMITSDRFLAIRHTVTSYPMTIEETMQFTSNSLIDLGGWQIQKPERSVQNSYCRVNVKADAGFKYLNKNTNIKPVKTNADGIDSYTWEIKNLKAIKLEDGSQSWKVMPSIYFTNSSFEYAGIPGNVSTWTDFGKWIQGLNADVCTLSPQRVDEIKKMTADIKTDKEKAKFLYQYMQKSMRYVGIQLGIGGYKPFAANFVDQKKYGDCKALSNYMYALLKAVDIQANYALINAGTNEEPANGAFPYNYFNHAILCVPLKNDTTWLECTSSTQPFGKLGTFTENRNALLITENGGKLVNTPKSTMQDNQFNSEVHLTLQPDGSATANLKIKASGVYRNDFISVDYEKESDQKATLIKNLNMRQPYTFSFKPTDDKEGIKEISMDMEYDKFCDIKAGDKLFYKPRVFDLWQFTVPVLEKRLSDFYFESPMQKTCITTIDLPAGFEVESLPANASLKFTYGNYDVTYVYDAAKNQVIGTTKFNLTNYVIPAAKYNEMQQYMDNIAKAQNKKLIIKKKA